MRCMKSALLSACAVAWLAVGVDVGQVGGSDPELDKRLQTIATGHHGKVALFATDLRTGRSGALNADEPVQTASVIKLAILYEAMEEVREGKAKWDEKITLKPGEAVGGSGILHFFDPPMTL